MNRGIVSLCCKLCDRQRSPREHNEVSTAQHSLHYPGQWCRMLPVCASRLGLMSVGIPTHMVGNGLE